MNRGHVVTNKESLRQLFGAAHEAPMHIFLPAVDAGDGLRVVPAVLRVPTEAEQRGSSHVH